MSLVGNLEDLPLSDILQIVSLSRKSGVLDLTRENVSAKLYFQRGLVVSAMISDFKLDLGGFLVRKSLLSETDLAAIRERVRDGEALTSLLTETYGISEKILEGFSRAGIEKAVYRLFTWQEGAFTFDLHEELDESTIDPFLPYFPAGINPQFLAMEGARLKDESDYFTTRTKFKGGESASDASGPEKDAASPGAPPVDKESDAPATTAPSEAQAEFRDEESPEIDLSTFANAAADTAPGDASDTAGSDEQQDAAATSPAPTGPMDSAVESTDGPEAVPSTDKPLVVLVDNDVVAIRNIQGVLQEAGYEVAPFNRVEAVIKAVRELLRKGRRLILLVDLVMPKRDASGMLGGLEVLEVLRGEEQHVPMVMLADLENAEAEERARELGVDAYVSKPGRKFYVREANNTFAEFITFMGELRRKLAELEPKASAISASSSADPFVDLGRELHGELEAATVAVSASAPTGSAYGQEKSRGLDMLKEMVRQLNDPHFNADVSLLILRFAVELMSRAAIFVVANDTLVGLGQAGLDRPDANTAVREMRIPLNEPSIFADVLKHRSAITRKLDSTPWNRYLLETLGPEKPVESLAAPVFTSRRIAAIVYADNGGENKPIGDVDALEIFLSHAGIAMERSLLERRLRDLTSG